MGDFNRDQFEAALKYAKQLWESVDIMEDQHGAFSIIRMYAVPHWEKQGYKSITQVRLAHVISGRGAAPETPAECPHDQVNTDSRGDMWCADPKCGQQVFNR